MNLHDQQPTVSIVMPVYNVEKYLDESIRSVLNQTFQDFELLIINDGSTDNSVCIAESYRQDDRVKIFSIPNSGISAARNFGMQHACGEYLYFIDPDDFAATNLLHETVNQMISFNSDMAIFDFNEVNEKSETIQSGMLLQQPSECLATDALIKKYLLGDVPNYAWSYVVKREAFTSNNIIFPEGKVYEDLAMFPHLLFSINHAVLLHQSLYNYRLRSDSLTAAKQISAESLTDYVMNLTENEDWLVNKFGRENPSELGIYFLRHFLQIFLTASKSSGLDYFSVIDIVIDRIKHYFSFYAFQKIAFKQMIVACIIKINLGRALYLALSGSRKRQKYN
ncbi:glycosyltransferase family 2 protein [Leuconostoc holzapfelii]|uniref:Glycosyltransferase family 2 protein n=1 Tax=Leuconostoc holzapfelii TaxID=434464 RepID=A0ABT2NSZ6_9LACO|nr:glycosyltransferase family 2 protein [Leuconostoc holzapfelii]MCT8388493.1 glycosyltransferase family 2 protein [Leuconostoc holzapfelii]